MKALLFDLDDTLFLEGDFVASGYRAVAEFIATRSGESASAVLLSMLETFARQGRRRVLGTVLRRHPVRGIKVTDLVRIYRGHSPRICLLPGYDALLRRLRAGFRLGILTDGLPEVQRGKIRALGLEGQVDGVVCTWELGRERQKPHPAGFGKLLSILGVSNRDCLYIGDNPGKDRIGAENAGVRFVHVTNTRIQECTPGTLRGARVGSLHELPRLIESLG